MSVVKMKPKLEASAGNKQGNLAGGKSNELFVSGGSDFGGYCDDGVEHAIDAVEERGVGSNGVFGNQRRPVFRRDAASGDFMAELGDVSTALA